MTRRLIVRPQARLELADASDWYDAQDKRLADDLLFAFEETISSIVHNPFQYQVIRGKTRRAHLGKFPYGLIYTVSDNEIVILSCFHGRRDPKRWQRRTK
ncbi:MAG TPA: type II toxin-antitoxin system RelE/ParE family toxin [Pseudolabrys sp.]|jgi:plasmid stabilization system protein ParE